MKIDLVYDQNCPNIERTRIALLKAFQKVGLPPKWSEWDRNAKESPDYVRKYGSPTVLVDKQDIAGLKPVTSANSCRIYENGGVPSVNQIVEAMRRAVSSRPRGAALVSPAALGPGLGAAILAKAACPLCYPAIGGLLTSLGLGFLFEGPYFIVLMSIFFSIALFGLAYQANLRRGYRPFLLGSISAVLAIGARILNVEWLFYGGIVGLILASFWNLIPKKNCQSCINQKELEDKI